MCQHIAEVARVVEGQSPYAVATADELDGSVTFSLQKNHGVWDENNLPLPGQKVILNDIRHHKGKGWRAFKARFFRPEDEEGN